MPVFLAYQKVEWWSDEILLRSDAPGL